jgi:endogenous inhibitor of DNA gyrase (YacG/DUF329 family)
MSERSPSSRPCRICGKPLEQRFRPFCSKRCADLDLAHWLKGDYAIAAREAPEGEEEGGERPREEGE